VVVEVALLEDSGIDPKFEEDWGKEIQPEVWTSFGDPAPAVVPDLSPTGAQSFVSNGDQNYGNGVISEQSFDASGGLTLEVEGHLPFTGNPFERFTLAVAEESPESTRSGPTTLASFTLESALNNRGILRALKEDDVRWEANVDTVAWHRYAIQIEPGGTVTALMDGAVLRRLQPRDATVSFPDRLRVVLGGSSLRVKVKHGRVQVYEGLKYVLSTGS